ncbi:cytidylyltransferase domain-containing protein [Alteromonas gracilis]|uniref:acylneuraminate cytidylyltransferase family protein n=1 Tax=Alteromonas gracilis TaxID=1479524 RepID=UPI0037359F2D
MKKRERVVAIVPARSGSKGLQDKNILELCGKPLMAWTIEAARAVEGVDDVILSTDSKRYAEIGIQHGAWVPFLREDSLSSDNASLMGVVQSTVHKLSELGYVYDVVMVLQPTSPLRNSEHIRSALNQFLSWDESPKSMASVFELDSKYRWILNVNEDGQLRFVDEVLNNSQGFNRQSNHRVFMPNGAIFIYQADFLSCQYQASTRPFVMSEETSADIDTIADFEMVLKTMKASGE